MRWRTVEDETGGGGALFDADELAERHVGRGEFRGMEFLHVRARRLISEVPEGSSMPFRYTVNPYRGCSHACTYCFARPTHDYLGLGMGEDFERRIVVKVNAVERLRAELAGRRWSGAHIAMGTNTDPYQRCEGRYHLTQGIVRVLTDAGNPFSILTKSTLVLRDLDLLSVAAEAGLVRVNLSIGTLDDEVWRLTEPGTPRPVARVEAVRRLNRAGIPTGVLIAPVLPGLSDGDDGLRRVVDACVDAGATSVSTVLLHLRPGVREVYLGRLRRTHPALADDTDARYRSAYLPKVDRRQLAVRVSAMVAEARGRSALAGRTRFVDGGPTRQVAAQTGLRPATSAAAGSGHAGDCGTTGTADAGADQLSLPW